MKLKGKRILITGASGGIGQAIARMMNSTGASLILTGRNNNKLTQLQNQLGRRHQVIVADLNRHEHRQQIVNYCEKTRIDILINAAGVLDFQHYENQSTATIEKVLTTNLLTPMLLCHDIIPAMQKNRRSTIINIGSIFGSIGHPGFAAYCASKFGLRGFTEALQRELSNTTIKVLYIAPRATQTDLNNDMVAALNSALGNAVDTPEQVARTVMQVLQKQQLQHYMGWPEKLFVKLNGLLPKLVHNALVKKLPTIQHYANINAMPISKPCQHKGG